MTEALHNGQTIPGDSDGASVFSSEDVDSEDAINEILDEVAKDGREPDTFMIFVGIDHEHQEISKAIYDRFGEVQVIGSTTDGEVSQEGYRQDSISLCCFWKNDKVRFKVCSIENINNDQLNQQIEQALDGHLTPDLTGHQRVRHYLWNQCRDPYEYRK